MSGQLRDVLVADAVRTPIGRFRGALADVRPDDLGAVVIAELVRRAGVDPAAVDDVFFGCANQAGEDNRNVARMALLLAGLPEQVPGATVNRLCGSGLEAVLTAARAIRAGEGEVFLAGGVESMTRAPWAMPKSSQPFPHGNVTLYDTSLEALAKLPAVFRKGGTVTAGNSSGLNDGAAAVLLMSDARARTLGLRPLARVVGGAAAGVDPRMMGIGPVPATRRALARAG